MEHANEILVGVLGAWTAFQEWRHRRDERRREAERAEYEVARRKLLQASQRLGDLLHRMGYLSEAPKIE